MGSGDDGWSDRNDWFYVHFIQPKVRTELLMAVSAVLARPENQLGHGNASSNPMAGNSKAIEQALEGLTMLQVADAASDRATQSKLTKQAGKVFAGLANEVGR